MTRELCTYEAGEAIIEIERVSRPICTDVEFYRIPTRFALEVARHLFAEYANIVYPIMTNPVAGREHAICMVLWID